MLSAGAAAQVDGVEKPMPGNRGGTEVLDQFPEADEVVIELHPMCRATGIQTPVADSANRRNAGRISRAVA